MCSRNVRIGTEDRGSINSLQQSWQDALRDATKTQRVSAELNTGKQSDDQVTAAHYDILSKYHTQMTSWTGPN